MFIVDLDIFVNLVLKFSWGQIQPKRARKIVDWLKNALRLIIKNMENVHLKFTGRED